MCGIISDDNAVCIHLFFKRPYYQELLKLAIKHQLLKFYVLYACVTLSLAGM